MAEVLSLQQVEQQFQRVVQAVKQRLQLLDRQPRIRVNAWLKKLSDEASSNITWQRNKLAYARLLLEQLRAGCLEVPFNTLPPEGALPTLPAYLTYRFNSPPKQHPIPFGSLAEDSAASGPLRLQRPLSAGAGELPAGGAYDTWRVCGSPTASAASPQRSSTCSTALQQQRQQLGRGVRPSSPGAAGLMDAAAVVAAELQAEREEAARISSRLRYAEDKILQQEAELVRLQGAASAARRRVKTATAATLAELLERYGDGAAKAAGGGSPSAAGQGGSPRVLADSVYRPVWQLLSGLQSVLDSVDQEEQEWLKAKGAAAAEALQACYEAQSAAAAAAAAGTRQPGQFAGGSGGQGAAAAAAQAKGASQLATDAAAAAAAESAVLQHCEQCLMQLLHTAEELAGGLQEQKERATQAAGRRGPLTAVAVAADAAALLKPLLKLLKHESKDASKLRRRLEAAAAATDAAAAAASATAAAASASLLQLQQVARSSNSSGSDSSDSDCSSSSDSSSHRRHQLRQQEQLLAVAQQQQVAQDARLARLQSASQVLAELDKVSAKLQGQMKDAQQRLVGLSQGQPVPGGPGAGAGAGAAGVVANSSLQLHDNGLVAATTAGIAASLSAGLRSYAAGLGNLMHVLQSLRSAATAAAASTHSALGPQATAVKQQGGSSMRHSNSRSSSPFAHQDLQHASAGVVASAPAAAAAVRRGASVSFSGHVQHQQQPYGNGSSSASPRGRLSRSSSSRLCDAGLAGTSWGGGQVPAQPTPTPPAAAAGATRPHPLLLSRSTSAISRHQSGANTPTAATTAGAYDAASHYSSLLGAAAAGAGGAAAAGAGAAAGGGFGSSTANSPWDAARAGSSVPSSPRGPGALLGSKAAFTEQLQGGGAAISNSSSFRSSAADAAAESVHAQLAGLSRQASRLSLKASQILGGPGGGGGSAAVEGDAAAVVSGGVTNSTAAAAAAAASHLRVLTGSSSFGGSLHNSKPTIGTTSGAGTAGASPFVASLLSPRGTSSSNTGISTAAAGAGSMLSTAARAALLASGGSSSGAAAAAAAGGAAGLPGMLQRLLGASSSSSSLLGVGSSSFKGASSSSPLLLRGAAGMVTPQSPATLSPAHVSPLGGLQLGGSSSSSSSFRSSSPALGVGGVGSLVRPAGFTLGTKQQYSPAQLGLGGSAAAGAAGSVSSIAAISSRLQSLAGGSR